MKFGILEMLARLISTWALPSNGKIAEIMENGDTNMKDLKATLTKGEVVVSNQRFAGHWQIISQLSNRSYATISGFREFDRLEMEKLNNKVNASQLVESRIIVGIVAEIFDKRPNETFGRDLVTLDPKERTGEMTCINRILSSLHVQM